MHPSYDPPMHGPTPIYWARHPLFTWETFFITTGLVVNIALTSSGYPREWFEPMLYMVILLNLFGLMSTLVRDRHIPLQPHVVKPISITLHWPFTKRPLMVVGESPKSTVAPRTPLQKAQVKAGVVLVNHLFGAQPGTPNDIRH